MELGNADRSVRDYPEQAGAVAARDHAVTKLLELARLPRVHRFDGTTAGAYDATQCRDDIRDGDVLVVKAEGVVGFLAAAWPVAITEARGEFHGLKVPAREYEDGRYAASAERAEQIADELGFPWQPSPLTRPDPPGTGGGHPSPPRSKMCHNSVPYDPPLGDHVETRTPS